MEGTVTAQLTAGGTCGAESGDSGPPALWPWGPAALTPVPWGPLSRQSQRGFLCVLSSVVRYSPSFAQLVGLEPLESTGRPGSPEEPLPSLLRSFQDARL